MTGATAVDLQPGMQHRSAKQALSHLEGRSAPMPEAVIVSTARSPIGRAVKGSLKDIRPDDLAVQMVQAGGAIAVGHPFGMTGARITATLINSLQWHDKQFGVESMCVGGGQGMALILE